MRNYLGKCSMIRRIIRTLKKSEEVNSAKNRLRTGLPFWLHVACSLLVTPGLLAAAPYYEGKTISIVVGFGVGGGYDRMTRLTAKYLPKYIPGKPTIIIDNMPGAGSIIAANCIYNLEKPDGLTWGCINRGIPYSQLLKATGIKFDLRKFSWIGSAGSEATILAVRADLPYKTFEELRKAKMIMALQSTPDRMGRPYVAAPGTPPEIMKIIRDSFLKASKDPALIEESRRMKMDFQYVPAEECLKTVNFILNQPEENVKEISKYIKF